MAVFELVPQTTADELSLFSQFELDDAQLQELGRTAKLFPSFRGDLLSSARFDGMGTPEDNSLISLRETEGLSGFSKGNSTVTPFISSLPFEQEGAGVSPQIEDRVFRGPFVLATPLLPTGILVDAQNNIIVQAGGLRTTNIKYDPAGNILQQTNSTSGIIVGRRMASLPGSNLALSVNETGQISQINTDTLAEQTIAFLRNLPLDATRVYDFATGTVVNRSGVLLPFQTVYGDIAVRIEPTSVDLYISGVSVAFPYIMRVRFSQDGSIRSEALAFSSASTAPNENSPPGLAVNPQGVILTTLPTGNTTGTFNVPVFFTSDFSQGTGRIVPTRLGDRLFLSSRGMTSDAAGNFYVATSSIGVSGGGFSAAGAVVALNSTLSSIRFIDTGNESPLGRLEDIATNADGTAIYATQDLSTFNLGNERVIAYLASSPTADPLAATGVNADLDLLAGMSLDGIESTVDNNLDSITPNVVSPLSAALLSSGQGDVAITTELPTTEDSLGASHLLLGNTPIELSAFG